MVGSSENGNGLSCSIRADNFLTSWVIRSVKFSINSLHNGVCSLIISNIRFIISSRNVAYPWYKRSVNYFSKHSSSGLLATNYFRASCSLVIMPLLTTVVKELLLLLLLLLKIIIIIIVPVYPGFKTRWNYLETRRCVRDSDNGTFQGKGLFLIQSYRKHVPNGCSRIGRSGWRLGQWDL
jgi:hypothetical protein